LLSDHNHDFVILGGGVAGVTFALEASRRGQRVVLLESDDHVGGLLAIRILAGLLVAALYLVGTITWLRDLDAGYSLRRWVGVVGLGALFLPLALLRSSPAIDAALFAAFVVGYGGLLFLLGWVTPDELGVMGRAVTGARRPALGTSGDQSS
jgi:glycine/D-amino acid oxidase-like deaminating enzyme